MALEIVMACLRTLLIISMTPIGCNGNAQNLALHAVTVQSPEEGQWALPSANAVDGNYVTSYHWCTETAVVPFAWWSVDLGRAVAVGYLTIFRRTDDYPERLRQFTVGVRMTSPVEEPSQQIIPMKTCYKFEGLPSGDVFNVTCQPTAVWGRHVVIQLNYVTDTVLNLCEVEVYAGASALTFATWGNASASSEEIAGLNDYQVNTCMDLANDTLTHQNVLLRGPLPDLTDRVWIEIDSRGISWDAWSCSGDPAVVLVHSEDHGNTTTAFSGSVAMCLPMREDNGRWGFMCDCTSKPCGVLSLHLMPGAYLQGAQMCHVTLSHLDITQDHGNK